MIFFLCSEEWFREGEVMVEVMSQSTNQEKLKLPKNIRQIGLPEEKKKIYVEDYVVTYMNQLASEYANRQNAAVLLGFYVRKDDIRLTFVNGAIGIPAAKVGEDQITFDSGLWEEIYNTIKKYFHNSEIVGWFLTRPGKSLGINEKITKIHVDQFPGREKTLFLMDPLDHEDAFFIYEKGQLVRQRGYYIYYERNEDMQNYMVENHKGTGTEEFLETSDIRKSNQKYSQFKEEKPKRRGVLGAFAAALAIVAVGITVMNRVYFPQKARIVNGKTGDETTTVQVVEGSVHPLDSQREVVSNRAEELESEVGGKQDDSADSEYSAAVSGGAAKHYTVRKGDTLANISLSLYSTRDYVEIICEMNNIEDPDVIYEGMVLELP